MQDEYERELPTVLFAWSRAHFDPITEEIRSAVVKSAEVFDAWELGEEDAAGDQRESIATRAADWRTDLEASIDRVSDAHRSKSQSPMPVRQAWDAVRADFNENCDCSI